MPSPYGRAILIETHICAVADFLDVERYPAITHTADQVEVIAEDDYLVKAQLTIRGASREVVLKTRCLGQWTTPWWEDGVDKGAKTRAGFYAETEINRHDFGLSWNRVLDRGGVVVGSTVEVTIDAKPSWSVPRRAGLRMGSLAVDQRPNNYSTVGHDPSQARQIDVLVALLQAVAKPDGGRDEIRTPRQDRYPRRPMTDPDCESLGNRHHQREDR